LSKIGAKTIKIRAKQNRRPIIKQVKNIYKTLKNGPAKREVIRAQYGPFREKSRPIPDLRV
jgi:hypothetical protein